MEVACYVGVIALKEKMAAVVDHLKKQLDKFQEKYEKETIKEMNSLDKKDFSKLSNDELFSLLVSVTKTYIK